MPLDPAFWQGRRVLVTGHTGFMGAWLCAWLARLGARVTGLGLPPGAPSLYALAGIEPLLQSETGDVRDAARLNAVLRAAEPEIAFHLAARRSASAGLGDPLGTFQTNLMGTLHLLEAARGCPTLRALVIAAGDQRAREPAADAPVALDPSGASMACTEIAVGAWRSCFLGAGSGLGLATARMGTVIGAGDFAAGRLLPDLIRAARAGAVARLRAPHAARPWLHVLDALSGFLALAEALWWRPAEASSAWSFCPGDEACWSVAAIADEAFRRLGYGSWRGTGEPRRHDPPPSRPAVDRAMRQLGWRAGLDTETAVAWTVEGYVELLDRGGRTWLNDQIDRYEIIEADLVAPPLLAVAAAPAAACA